MKKERQSILCFPALSRTSPDRIPLLFLPPIWLQLIKAQTLKLCLHRWSQADDLCPFLL